MTMQEPTPGGWVNLGHPGPVVSAVSQPAAGHDWSYKLPAEKIVRVAAVRATLATSATAANRIPRLQITSANGDVLSDQPIFTTITASQVVSCTWAIGLYFGGGLTGGLMHPLPDLWLPPGCSVGPDTLALDAADQWSAIVLTFEQRHYAPQYGPTTGD